MGSCADTVSFVFSFVLSFMFSFVFLSVFLFVFPSCYRTLFAFFCGVSGVPFTDVFFCYGWPPGHWKVHKRVIRGFVRFSWIGVVCRLKGVVSPRSTCYGAKVTKVTKVTKLTMVIITSSG